MATRESAPLRASSTRAVPLSTTSQLGWLRARGVRLIRAPGIGRGVIA